MGLNWCGAWILCLLAVHPLLAPASWAETPAEAGLAWDGHESIDLYAARVGLPSTRQLDLPGGETMTFVLIPAGTFLMGTETPPLPMEELRRSTRMTLGGLGGLALLVALVLGDAMRRRSWPRLKVWLAVLVVTLSTVLIAGAVRLREAQREYRRAEQLALLPDIERPAHPVTLTRPFYMGIHEVTQAQWAAVEANNPSAFPGRRRPVESMPWMEAVAFTGKLPAPEGWVSRLPSEAEWEYACRAGTTTTYWFGDEPELAEQFGWWPGNSSAQTADVGGKPPNPWGLHDMHGNVWEWCLDPHRPYRAHAQDDPLKTGRGDGQTIRGGSYLNTIEQGRSASRWPGGWSSPSNDIGVRIVLVTD